MPCEFLKTCPFFLDKLDSKPVTAETYKKQYCRADYRACARYRVAKSAGSDNVPRDLFPNQLHKVDQILSQD